MRPSAAPGKPSCAKQLAQYGVCLACQLAARVASLEPEDLLNLKFMLGAKQSPRSQWGNRNVYGGSVPEVAP